MRKAKRIQIISIDSFSSEAADLKPGHRTPARVLRALTHNPRISTFDMSEKPWLQGCIDALKKSGEITEDKSEPYPWHLFIVTPVKAEGGAA